MRDLNKILRLFENEFVMDYCEEFDELKSILEYVNQHEKPFNKIHFRGGNEAIINELVRRLQQMLLERQLVDTLVKEPVAKSYQILRKMVMFLFANTDCTYKYNLHDDPNIAHVLEICPLLPKFLLVTLMWDLSLDQFFYEVLSYAPCWFTFQYFDVASDSLKYIDDPIEVLHKVEQLVRAIYVSITRSKYRIMDKVDVKIIFGKLYDCTMKLLRQFYTPDSEKFRHFTKKQFYSYSGFALKHLLQMILFAIDVYETPSKADPTIDIEIYEICQELCKQTPITKGSLPEESVELKEQQIKIITALLNSLQNNVMLVKIDIFVYWVEIDVTPQINLQTAIGEMAYAVCERLSKNRRFAHDVEQQLKMIAIRPKTLAETVEAATIGDILRSLDEPLAPDVKSAWLNELMNRPLALGNDECLDAIRDNMKLITVDHCKKILDFINLEIIRNAEEEKDYGDDGAQNRQDSNEEKQQDIQIDYDAYDDLIVIILRALQQFSKEQILEMLKHQLNVFGKSARICCRPDFQTRSTEFLNKFATNFDFQQFLIFCVEHPTMMWTKFFDSACHNDIHIKNFCTTVKEARPFSTDYFHTLLSGAMRDRTKIQQKFFPALLSEIYFVLYYPDQKTEFFKQFVNKNVTSLLDGQDFDSLLPIVKMLNIIATRGESQSVKPLNFGEITAPVLLMAAQIMDKTRWDLITYTDVRDEIVRECIQFIQNTSKKFLPVATEKDRKWVTKAIKDSYRPTTQYYFQKFSLTPEQKPVNFDRFLIRLEMEDKSEAEMFLIINYVRCTMKETEWLARSERLLPHISDVMIILGGVVQETESNTNSINNYRHCLSNYANIVRKYLLPQIENDPKKREKLVLKILEIIKSAPPQIYEESFINFECLLLDIITSSKHSFSEDSVKVVKKFVESMTDCKAKEIFLEKFQSAILESSN